MPTRACAAAVLALAIAGAGCKPPPPPIEIHHDKLTIYNRTGEAWQDVRVVVNHHFGGGAALLPAGGRFDVPLGRLQTGLGQKFDRSRQAVTRVEVTARTASGGPLRLLWPENADAPAKEGGRNDP